MSTPPPQLTCTQPACLGQLDEGYCDRCGMAPLSVSLSSASLSSVSLSSALPHPRATGRSIRSASIGSSGLSGKTIGSRPGTGRSRGLGLGLVTLPDLPDIAPETLLLTEAIVPLNKRICGNCNHQLKREKGFCGQCGQAYSFVASLKAGDVVAGQYDIKGALAFGGLGWIYLGFDRQLSRYVVLKGLLNTRDESSAAVALAERQFLAAVKHPNIVGVYTFVTHNGEGFIVMEYVGGRTLKDLRRDRGPLPVTEAIAYIHRVLKAFDYLHDRGLVYCDFKPDNVMLERGDIKLIDMGGVRRIDDPEGDIYGTVGYTAPEAGDGPTAVSDLFTIGRTLAVLVASIPSFTSQNLYQLPGPEEVAVFRDHPSLYHLLCRATAPDPAARFQSAEEMAEQLLGVLRETIALETGEAQPGASHCFGSDPLGMAIPNPQESIPIVIPHPNLDSSDPACNELIIALGISDVVSRRNSLEQIYQQYPTSLDTKLRCANQLIEDQLFPKADRVLTEAANQAPFDWRVDWYRGRSLFLQGKDSRSVFERVYRAIPGEIMPKLALGFTAEQQGDFAGAAWYYDRVLETDPSYLSAAFGLARCWQVLGDRSGAIAALDRIPGHSNLQNRAQLERARLLLDTTTKLPQQQDLQAASQTIETLRLEASDRHRLSQQLFQVALTLIDQNSMQSNSQVLLLGQPLEERSLRFGLEQSLLDLARLRDGSEKLQLVERANQVRPRTLI
jgi:serine/threonine-protein kinase PknG